MVGGVRSCDGRRAENLGVEIDAARCSTLGGRILSILNCEGTASFKPPTSLGVGVEGMFLDFMLLGVGVSGGME